MKKSAEIKINVELNDDSYPDKIKWSATDSGFEGKKEADAMLLSLWDKNEKSTMAIDLWTTDMLIQDLRIMYFEVFMKMAETYQNASHDKENADKIKDFAKQFAKNLGLLDEAPN